MRNLLFAIALVLISALTTNTGSAQEKFALRASEKVSLDPLPSGVRPECAVFHGVWGPGRWKASNHRRGGVFEWYINVLEDCQFKLIHQHGLSIKEDGTIDAVPTWQTYRGEIIPPKQSERAFGGLDWVGTVSYPSGSKVSFSLVGEALSLEGFNGHGVGISTILQRREPAPLLQTVNGVSIPSNDPPSSLGAGTPSKCAPFLGLWQGGAWNDTLPAALSIFNIDSVLTIKGERECFFLGHYAWGGSKPGYRLVVIRTVGTSIQIRDSDNQSLLRGFWFDFTLRGDDLLGFTEHQEYKITLRRQVKVAKN